MDIIKIVKVCKIHGELTEEECYKHKGKSVSGFTYVCKHCNREYCENNKEHKKEYDKEYREINKKKIKEYKKEYNKLWRENNKEYNKEYKKEYYKLWYENNKEHKKEYHNLWYKNNKEYHKEYYKSTALYNMYNDKISFCEETRRDPNNEELLQVRCTESSCRKWFNPTNRQVNNRVGSLNGNISGESRFYCSNKCKSRCSIYNQKDYPKGFIQNNQIRYDQNEWAELVKERDNYTCQKCGSNKKLVAHHIEGLNVNPLESADVDMGIALCEDCHKEIHKELGCTYTDLKRNNLCNNT